MAHGAESANLEVYNTIFWNNIDDHEWTCMTCSIDNPVTPTTLPGSGNVQWPEYLEMLNGSYGGHFSETVVVGPVMADHPICKPLEGKTFEMPERSVCDECPLAREKKAAGGEIKRTLDAVDCDHEAPWSDTRCFMEQGYLCLGPVTLAGCAHKEGGNGNGVTVPRCIKGHMPCRGCFGPIRKGANPMVDMMSAISSIGL